MRSMIIAGAALLMPLLAQAQDRQPVRPEGTATAGPYTPGIRAGGFVFSSGQLGVAPGTRALVAGGVAAETRQALENIGRIFAAGGTSLARATKCTVFLTDINDFGAMNAEYVKFFPADPPARSTVAVAALVLGAKVEIECIAAV